MTGKLACLGMAALLISLQGAIAWNAEEQARPKDPAQARAFKVTTELVEVRAVVTDRQGRVVEDLKKEDFELLENNRPQQISFFSLTRVEGEKRRTDENVVAAPDWVAGLTGMGRRLTEAPARSVVLFVDTLHLSVSSLMQVKQALRSFVEERLTPQDMIALVTSGGSLGIAEQFTRDPQLLRYGIDRIGPGPSSKTSFFTPYLAARIEHGDADAMNVAIALLRLEEGIEGDRRIMESMARARAAQVLSEASHFRRATLFTLQALAAQMMILPGQRMIAMFSDGFTLQERGGSPQTGELQAVISRAVRSGVAIYSIDAGGLRPPPLSDASMRGGAAGPGLESYLRSSEQEEQDGLNALALDTGGEMYTNTNDLGGALGRALDANRSYYVLAYYLTAGSDVRQFRRITVRVKNHPEYVVRTPRGFLPSDIAKAQAAAAGETPQQRLVKAIRAPLPMTDLDVSASADFLEIVSDNAQVSLSVRLGGDNLDYRERDGQHLAAFQILSEVYDSAGKCVEKVSNLVQGSLTPERLALSRQNGYQFSRRLALKPGVYQARVGILEPATERMGTASAWVEVPNLTRTKLALSSLILLGSRSMDSTASNDRVPETLNQSKMVQGVRLYARGQACRYFFRVRFAAKTPPDSSLSMQTELVQGGKPVLREEWQTLSVRETDKDSKGWVSVLGQVDLTGLQPGFYELCVTVKDPQAKRMTQRTATLSIE